MSLYLILFIDEVILMKGGSGLLIIIKFYNYWMPLVYGYYYGLIKLNMVKFKVM